MATRPRPVRMVAAISLAAALAVVNPGSAAAQPDVDTVQKKVHSLGVKVETITENYIEAKRELKNTKRQVTSLTERVQEQQRQVERLRAAASGLAASTYMGGATDLAALTTAKSPQELVDRTTSLEQISAQDRGRLADYVTASKMLDSRREAASKAMANQRSITKKLKDQKTTIAETLDKQKALLQRLTAAERASRADRQPTVDLPAVSGRVGAVIEFAKAQLGKPYEWGADGPDSYDCSGLTMAAWREGGVSLPHSSRSQQNSGPPVDRSQIEPGDLLFFGDPVHHVGLYVGGNQMISAPQTGDNVRYRNINDSYYREEWAGAVRPQ